MQHFLNIFPFIQDCNAASATRMQETYLYGSPAFSARVQVRLELLCGHDFHDHAPQNCARLKRHHCQKNNVYDDINCTTNSALRFRRRFEDLQHNLNTINPKKDTLHLGFSLLSPFLPMLRWDSVAMSIKCLFQKHMQA